MLQIQLLYDFYFFMCAYIMAKPYVVVVDVYDHVDSKFIAVKIPMYSLSAISAHMKK